MDNNSSSGGGVVVPDLLTAAGNLSREEAIYKYDCSSSTNDDRRLQEAFNFWFGGCVSLIIAVPGFFGNIGAAYVLSLKDMRNSFNLLLIAMACFDNAFLFFDSIRGLENNFNLHSEIQAKLFPWLLYPLNAITMTASILMTVAIAIERYVAVHYPLDYSQAMNDKHALKQRMIRYLMPVFFLSLLFNITKFFEAKFFYDEKADKWLVAATSLRKNSTYSIATNWFRTLALGVVPFVMLVVANFKIYSDIQDRRKRNMFRKSQAAAANANYSNHKPVASAVAAEPASASVAAAAAVGSSAAAGGSSCNEEAGRLPSAAEEGAALVSSDTTVAAACNTSSSPTSSSPTTSNQQQQNQLMVKITGQDDFNIKHASDGGQSNDALGAKEQSGQSPSKQSSNGSLLGQQNLCETVMFRQKFRDGDAAVAVAGGDPKNLEMAPLIHNSQKYDNHLAVTSSVAATETPGGCTTTTTAARGLTAAAAGNDNDNISADCAAAAAATSPSAVVKRPPAPPPPAAPTSKKPRNGGSGHTANTRRRKMEDHLASIFMCYILVFLICHAPRLTVNIYELYSIKKALVCQKLGMEYFPIWSDYLVCVSNVFLVLNSSINILIYCILSSKFREECRKLSKKLFKDHCSSV